MTPPTPRLGPVTLAEQMRKLRNREAAQALWDHVEKTKGPDARVVWTRALRLLKEAGADTAHRRAASVERPGPGRRTLGQPTVVRRSGGRDRNATKHVRVRLADGDTARVNRHARTMAMSGNAVIRAAIDNLLSRRIPLPTHGWQIPDAGPGAESWLLVPGDGHVNGLTDLAERLDNLVDPHAALPPADPEWQARYDEAGSIAPLAKEEGVSIETMRKRLVSHGVRLRSAGQPTDHPRPEPRDALIRYALSRHLKEG